MVYLIGAGPGDPDLLTVKGRTALQQADVVLYDRLVAPELLALAPPSAELIYVGKVPRGEGTSQTAINQLLVQFGREKEWVIRLKGGDPFVFGRGSEEAQALREAGVPYQIVPGVSSALAVPALAYIPVTHRQLANGFTVLTGHTVENLEQEIAWERLPNHTLIFLMGVENLPLIVQKLSGVGWSAETPTALIENGTRPEERVVIGRLGDIVAKAQAHAIQPPAIIIIGEVVGLRSQLTAREE